MLLRQHNVLQRHALLLKAALLPLDDADRGRLEVKGLLQGALCRAGTACALFLRSSLLCFAVPSPSASPLT